MSLLSQFWPSLEDSTDDDVGFETGVTDRRVVDKYLLERLDFRVLGEPVEIAGAHVETRTEASREYSSLGTGGIVQYPDRNTYVYIVTKCGRRVEMEKEGWDRMMEASAGY